MFMIKNKPHKIMAWRLAELISEKDGHLDVIVMNRTANQSNKINGVGNTTNQSVVGVSNFQEEISLSSLDILKDFVIVHGSPSTVARGENYVYARYIPQFKATIPLAFVTYFSKKRQESVTDSAIELSLSPVHLKR